MQEWEIFPIMSKIGIWNSETYKKKYIDIKRRMSTGQSLFHSQPKVAAIGEDEDYLDSDIDHNTDDGKSSQAKKDGAAKLASPENPKGLAGVEITIHVRRRYEYYGVYRRRRRIRFHVHRPAGASEARLSHLYRQTDDLRHPQSCGPGRAR